MKVFNTNIEGLVVIQPKVYDDNRGYFMESFNINLFNNFHKEINFVQDNESFSSYGVLRGLHYQKKPYDQSKLVRTVKGEILDVAVDIRKDSDTFGRYESVILSEINKKQLFIPKGFAHGFIVLSDYAIVQYKVDNYFSKEHDAGIHYNDKFLNIDWKIPNSKIKLSPKDLKLPLFNTIDF